MGILELFVPDLWPHLLWDQKDGDEGGVMEEEGIMAHDPDVVDILFDVGLGPSLHLSGRQIVVDALLEGFLGRSLKDGAGKVHPLPSAFHGVFGEFHDHDLFAQRALAALEADAFLSGGGILAALAFPPAEPMGSPDGVHMCSCQMKFG